MSETQHAKLSPSSAERWMLCPGSVALSEGLPDTSSQYADEGTAAHQLASWCLTEGRPAEGYIGRVIQVGEREFEVDEDMAGYVQVYVDHVLEYAKGDLLVEQRVPIGHVTGEAGAEGTSDAVILLEAGDELQVHDLKYGRGVQVFAPHNRQLKMYALGALDKFGPLGDFKRIRMVIHQPRLAHLSEWDCSVEELQAFAREAGDAAQLTRVAQTYLEDWRGKADSPYLNPGEEQCQWCKAKATCPAIAAKVQDEVGQDFETLAAAAEDDAAHDQVLLESVPEDPGQLGLKMRAIDLIEDWCRAVRAKVEAELFAGLPVPGFKLVEGKKGHRQWSDAGAAEAALKSMRLKKEQMYNFKLVSPAQAEKLLKPTPKRWKKLQPLITQGKGQPSVAPESDKRPPWKPEPVEDDFADETVPADAEDLV